MRQATSRSRASSQRNIRKAQMSRVGRREPRQLGRARAQYRRR